jgi:hypothetical protein
MISQFEKWVGIGFFSLVVMMFVGAGLASHQRNSCRLELAKAGRSAEDIVKICP